MSLEEDRFLGCLCGLAIGDAVGTSAEFKPVPVRPRVTDMIGGGPHRLRPGDFTDDTSMALCLGYSLLKKRGMNLRHQLLMYRKWKNEGFMSSNGRVFDIGTTIRAALARFGSSGCKKSICGSKERKKSGNGCLMRLAPVPMLYFARPFEKAVAACGRSSLTTHASDLCVQCCEYYGGLVWGALHGVPKEELLGLPQSPPPTPAQEEGEEEGETSSAAAPDAAAAASEDDPEESEAVFNGWVPSPPRFDASECPTADFWVKKNLDAELWDIIRGGSFRKSAPNTRQLPKIRDGGFKGFIVNAGYVVKAMEAAMWAFCKFTSFRDGTLAITNNGHDSDTVGAIYGMLQGAYGGYNGIPESWRQKLKKKKLISKMARDIMEMARPKEQPEEAAAADEAAPVALAGQPAEDGKS